MAQSLVTPSTNQEKEDAQQSEAVQRRLLFRLRNRKRKQEADTVRPVVRNMAELQDVADRPSYGIKPFLKPEHLGKQGQENKVNASNGMQNTASNAPETQQESGPQSEQDQDNASPSSVNGRAMRKQPVRRTQDNPPPKQERGNLADRLGNEVAKQEEASRPTSRLGKAAEQRALKRGLGQARARGVASGVEALARGEGARGAAESAASSALALKKYQQFKNMLLIAKVSTGITLVGIVITIAIWGVQLVMGHMLKKEKWKLGKIELWIAASIWSLITVVAMLQLFSLIYILWVFNSPLSAFFEAIF